VARTSRIFQEFKLILTTWRCAPHVCILSLCRAVHNEETEGTNCGRVVDEYVWEVSLTKDGSGIDVEKKVSPLNTGYVMGGKQM